MKKITLILCLSIFALTFNCCNKESDKTAESYPYSVKMTDAPGPYSAVFIDLKEVEITSGNGSAVLLNVNPGIYNLLNFSNGIDTLIASGILHDANVEQIRLILGSNNSIVKDSIAYPLSTPSAEQSGLKLQVHQTLQAGIAYSVLIDFDANKSIVVEGNGTYKLKPVLRTIEAAISGTIRGSITPVGTLAYVTATSNSGETYSTNVNSSGNFLLMGVASGTYSVVITPVLPLLPASVSNIAVTSGNTTTLATIALH